jgi:hypothetical protein
MKKIKRKRLADGSDLEVSEEVKEIQTKKINIRTKKKK